MTPEQIFITAKVVLIVAVIYVIYGAVQRGSVLYAVGGFAFIAFLYSAAGLTALYYHLRKLFPQAGI
jgi:hypothetical protein